ncbi:DUF4159 domain-containing protein [Pontibacter chitinilyticus]|uniref:DUF4159 domain-containing protein n=1 Tax=Pontibacter chitinilyticus TaxID=2674989 RepID=UPI003219B885
MKKSFPLLVILLLALAPLLQAQQASFRIAKLKYNGGGDWYANKTSLPNLIQFCNKNLNMNIAPEEDVVEVGSPELFSYPFVHMTGHGNVVFTDDEAQNLRNYLLSGGFLHIDDNYGLDKFIRREMKKVFPEHEFVELPFDHPIYKEKYVFNHGLPKIHEHDGKPPQGFGIIHEGRLVCFYTYETDLGNGWEDHEVYNDPIEKHEQALKMGANLLAYVLTRYQ